MSKAIAPLVFLVLLAGIAGAPERGDAASWEVGWSYIPETTSREPNLWEYFGQRVSAGITESLTPNIQLGGHLSYGRYRYSQYGVIDPGDPPSWRSSRTAGTEGAIDLGLTFRAIPPPETQRVREFVFFSYAVRMMESHSDALDDIHLFSCGFGGLVRLGEGTRLVVQAGPTFDWDMSYSTLPVSLMIQYGSP